MSRTSYKENSSTNKAFQKAKTMCNGCKFQDRFECCTYGATSTMFNAIGNSYPHTWDHHGRTRPYPPPCKDKNPDGTCKQFTRIELIKAKNSLLNTVKEVLGL